jgi:hypothetical protein
MCATKQEQRLSVGQERDGKGDTKGGKEDEEELKRYAGLRENNA